MNSKDNQLFDALMALAGAESKQPGSVPLEDNINFIAANRLQELNDLNADLFDQNKNLAFKLANKKPLN